MASKGANLINLSNISVLLRRYDLPLDPVPLPQIGEGSLYKGLKYNMLLGYIAEVILVSIIGALIIFDRKKNQIGNQVIHPSNTET